MRPPLRESVVGVFPATGETRDGLVWLRFRGVAIGWPRSGRGSFTALFPLAVFEQGLADVEAAQSSRDDVLLTLVTGWMAHVGPTRLRNLGCVGAFANDVEKALLRMEGGQCCVEILPGTASAGGGARAAINPRRTE